MDVFTYLLGKKAGKVLYSDATGTNGDVTLSESSANFKFIEIYYVTDEQYRSIKIYEPDGKKVQLIAQTLDVETPRIYGKTKCMVFDGASLSVVNFCQYAINNNSMGYLQTADNRNTIYITNVIGYK